MQVPLICHPKGGVSYIRSDSSVKFGDLTTVTAAPYVKLFATATVPKFYYEVEVVKRGGRSHYDKMQLGWVTEGFKPSSCLRGVGNAAGSWACDGCQKTKLSEGTSSAFGSEWAVGDIVGVAIDLAEGTISYSHRGSYSSPYGVAFTHINVPAGWVMPALSASKDSVCNVNFGDRSFRHSPPDGKYISVHAAYPTGGKAKEKAKAKKESAGGAGDWAYKGEAVDVEMQKASDRCLGSAADERVGVVVKVPLARLEMPRTRLHRLTSRHINPPSSSRCRWPAWKCVQIVEGPLHPGTPISS